MLAGILITLAVIIILFVVIVALRPAEFRIERKGRINAPASAVFPYVNDFHNWTHWSPWAKLDPTMKETYEGPSSGKGAQYHWIGNNQVGEGRMTIAESRPSELVRIKLDFIKPFAANNIAEFTFKPEGNQTAVSWVMTGRNNFMFKAMGLLMNMDKMIGKSFDQGLAQMKSVVESQTSK